MLSYFCEDNIDETLLGSAPSDTYGQAASNVVAGTNLEQTIQRIMDMGGGMWDTDMVTRALRAAYNNPERAVDYLYSVRFDCSTCFVFIKFPVYSF